MQRRLAAILAADVVGYSRLMGADEVGTLTSLKLHRRELVDSGISEHHGRILRIAENTEPLSTKIISSGGPAKGVLEVIAGTAQKYGIRPGDRVAHPLFNGR